MSQRLDERVLRARDFFCAGAMEGAAFEPTLGIEHVANARSPVVVDAAASRVLNMRDPSVKYVCSTQTHTPLVVLSSSVDISHASGSQKLCETQQALSCTTVNWCIVDGERDSPWSYLCPEYSGVRWAACTHTDPAYILSDRIVELVAIPLTPHSLALYLCAGNRRAFNGGDLPYVFPRLLSGVVNSLAGTTAASLLRREVARVAQRIGLPEDPVDPPGVQIDPAAIGALHQLYPGVFPVALADDPTTLTERQECLLKCVNSSKAASVYFQLRSLKSIAAGLVRQSQDAT